jgi:peptidoglycan/LPS O-acetylase OafA/YrhL
MLTFRAHGVPTKACSSPTTRGQGLARFRSVVARAEPAVACANTQERRLPELDGLRGLACLVIVFYHIAPSRLPGGWAAVDLFFVLSGFLITSIALTYSNERNFLTNFYIRRALRIWPIYFLTVLSLAVAAPILPRPCNFAGLPYVLTYTQNVPRYWACVEPKFSAYLDHAWSLAVEEQFYLIWPLLVCLVGRRGIVPLSLSLVCVSVCARSCGLHWWLLLARGDGLALGSFLAAVQLGRSETGRRWGGLQVSFGAVSLAAFCYLSALTAAGGMSTVGVPRWPSLTLLAVNLLCFGIVGLVVFHEGQASLRVLRGRRLVWLGKLSYGLYMYHLVMLMLSDDLAAQFGLGGRPFWRMALTVALIVTLAGLSWRYVESPLLVLKDRFRYRPLLPRPPNRSAHIGITALGGPKGSESEF